MSNRPLRGRLGEGLEVAAPDGVGVAVRLPDVVAVVVDGPVADEVDRADDVVEVVAVEQVGDPVLGAGHEVDLEAEPERGRAHELAVGVEVVARLLLPERVSPDLERIGEPVDVLGAAQLVDPRLLGRRQVALHVLGRERARAPAAGRRRPARRWT